MAGLSRKAFAIAILHNLIIIYGNSKNTLIVASLHGVLKFQLNRYSSF